MNTAVSRWIKTCFFNLFLVSLLGVILRYKIAFPLPFVQQKFMLHAHSHFAFAGWISQALMVLLVYKLQASKQNVFDDYRSVLIANLVTAYGMLLSFPFQGYGLFSIVFSTLNIFASYWFAIKYWKDLNKQPSPANAWIKAGVFFNALSSLGAFTLAFLMAGKIVNEKLYLAAIYFFLHFQYNGWFMFGCIGLLIPFLVRAGVSPKTTGTCFILFLSACVPTYFLSATWIKFPLYLYLLVVAGAIAQVAAYIVIASALMKKKRPVFPGSDAKYLFSFSAIALAIKLLLQLASTYPPLTIYIFGFRPVIIGYLHLVLLGVVTLFLSGYIISNKLIAFSATSRRTVKLFTAGIIINELFLALQGASALGYATLPHMEKLLLGAGLIMFVSLLALNISLGKSHSFVPVQTLSKVK